MKKMKYKALSLILISIVIISTLIIIYGVFPLIEERHPSYDNSVVYPHYGLIEPHIKCPVCDSNNITPFQSELKDDNHNKKILTFFYCQNCSTIFSVHE